MNMTQESLSEGRKRRHKVERAVRVEGYRLLLEALKNGRMTMDAMGAVVGGCKSHRYHFRRVLEAHGVIKQVSGPGGIEHTCAVYELLPKADLELFMSKMGAAYDMRQELASAGANFVHVMEDDEPLFQRKHTKKNPPRHWLDRALFGDGPAPSLAMEVA